VGNSLDLVGDLFAGREQKQVPDGIENHVQRLRQHTGGDDHRHQLIEIGRHRRQRCFKQKILHEKSRANANAAGEIHLPAVDLRFHRGTGDLFAAEVHHQQNNAASQSQCELQNGNKPVIQMATAVQHDLYIGDDQTDGDRKQHKAFDDDEHRFKLSVAVGLIFADRLIKQRCQKQRQPDNDQFRRVEHRIHQNGLRVAPKAHADLDQHKDHPGVQRNF